MAIDDVITEYSNLLNAELTKKRNAEQKIQAYSATLEKFRKLKAGMVQDPLFAARITVA